MEVFKQADWYPLSKSYKLVLLKFMHKVIHNELPQLLSDNIVIKRATGYSLRTPESNGASFQATYGKNSIAHRGPELWNTLIFKDKNFPNISCKDLKRKTLSMDIIKDLNFKETFTTTTNFRRKDFDYI